MITDDQIRRLLDRGLVYDLGHRALAGDEKARHECALSYSAYNWVWVDEQEKKSK